MCDPLNVIVAVYNEAENFPALIGELEQHIPQPFTMHVVYDFEEDTTVPVALSLARDRPWIKLLKNDLGPGVVNALRVGFQTVSSGPALVGMADLSDDLSTVPRLLALYRQGYRIVCPSRYMRGGHQDSGRMLKRLLSRAAGLSLRWLFGFPTHDATNNFRLYDAEFVNKVGIESTGSFEVAFELTAKAFRRGLKIAEVPTTWRDRTAGSSRFHLFRLLPKYLYWYAYVVRSRLAFVFLKGSKRDGP